MGSVVLAVILAVALVWRVSREPLSLGFLAPYLAESLLLSNSDLRVDMADVVLAWDPVDEALRLRVIDAELSGGAPGIKVNLPEVDLALSGRSLLQGVLAPTFLKISGIEAQLIRELDGHFLLGLPDSPAATPVQNTPDPSVLSQVFAALFDHLSKPMDLNDPFGQLESVSVGVSQLIILDRKLGQRWIMPGAVLQLRRADAAVRADFRGSLDWRDRKIDLSAHADYRADTRIAGVSASFDGVSPADFADLLPSFKPLSALESVLAGNLEFQLNQRGEVTDLVLELRAGAGLIERPDLFPQPLRLAAAHLRGRFETVEGRGETAHIDSLEISFADGLSLRAAGRVDMPAPGRYGLELTGRFADLATNNLRHYWPLGMAKNARDWVMAKIRDGQVPQGDFIVRLSPEMLEGNRRLPRDAVTLTFSLAGIGVDYFPPLTRMTEGVGKARLDSDTFSLTLESGRVGPLNAAKGKLLINGLQDRDQFADIEVAVSGSNQEMLSLIDRRPLGFPTRVGIRPDGVAGTGSVTTSFRFPLENNLKLDDVKFVANADLSGVTLPNIYDRFQLADGRIKLKVDQNGLDAEGHAALNGVESQLWWRQEFAANVPVTARYRVSMQVDDAGRQALGFVLAPFVAGPLYAEAEIESLRANSETVIRTKIDLASARFSLPELFVDKAPGQAGTARFIAHLLPGQATRFDDVALQAADFELRGQASLSVDKSWDVTFPTLKLAAGALSGRFRRAANGDVTINGEGRKFNLSRFVEQATAEDPPGHVPQPGPRLNLRLRFDEAQIDEKTSLNRFALDLQKGPLLMERLDLGGAFPGGGALAVQIAPRGSNRDFRLRSEDAGGVFLYLGVENMVGGTMAINAEYRDDQPGSPFSGTLTASNFKAVQAPFLARLAGIGSFSGIAALLSGEGLLFETATVPFRQHDGVLQLQPSRIQGPQLGITLDGRVDRRANQVNITGTAVPAFVLNTILGRIPLLGDIFIGEGIVGVNFAATGPREKVDVSVNPLSAIAPGFLRRIFQASGSSDGGGGQSQESRPEMKPEITP